MVGAPGVTGAMAAAVTRPVVLGVELATVEPAPALRLLPVAPVLPVEPVLPIVEVARNASPWSAELVVAWVPVLTLVPDPRCHSRPVERGLGLELPVVGALVECGVAVLEVVESVVEVDPRLEPPPAVRPAGPAVDPTESPPPEAPPLAPAELAEPVPAAGRGAHAGGGCGALAGGEAGGARPWWTRPSRRYRKRRRRRWSRCAVCCPRNASMRSCRRYRLPAMRGCWHGYQMTRNYRSRSAGLLLIRWPVRPRHQG